MDLIFRLPVLWKLAFKIICKGDHFRDGEVQGCRYLFTQFDLGQQLYQLTVFVQGHVVLTGDIQDLLGDIATALGGDTREVLMNLKAVLSVLGPVSRLIK